MGDKRWVKCVYYDEHGRQIEQWNEYEYWWDAETNAWMCKKITDGAKKIIEKK